jgi:DNA-binding beta-propeller fold protein YncE
MWDAKALTVIKTIPVEGSPDGILYDPYNERVWIFSHVAPFATVIDGKEGTVVGTIDLGGAPEQAVTDENGTIYANLTDKASIAVVNAKDLSVKTHYDLSSKGMNIGGLAYDVKNQILFSYLHQPSSMVVILSATDGKIITTLSTGEGVDTVAFNPKTMEAISTDGGSGTITVIKETSPTTFSLEQTLPTMKGARTMTLDSKTGHIVTQTAEFGPPPPLPPEGGRRDRPQMIPGSFTLLMIGR